VITADRNAHNSHLKPKSAFQVTSWPVVMV